MEQPLSVPDFDDATLLERAELTNAPDDPADGLFEPDCWLRRISGESVVLLGGGRALLLEIAHPVVAAGVAYHSNFRRDPFGRLQRTLEAMRAITFADRATALAAVRSFEAAHVRVAGVLPNDVGSLRAGTAYSAADPDARRWVWATLVDTAIEVYRCFVGDLSAEALEAYYADHRAMARLLGIPAEWLPGSWSAFRAFIAETLAGDALVVDATARDIAAAVLDPPGGMANAKLIRLLSTALLPESLRAGFGLAWGPDKARRFEELVESVRRLRGRDGPERAVDGGALPR